MRTQLNLLSDRVSFTEACDADFRNCALTLAPAVPLPPPPANAPDVCGAPLSRWHKNTDQAALTYPAAFEPSNKGANQSLLFDVHLQVSKMTPGQICILSLNFGVLDRVPDYFTAILDGDRLRHPIEFASQLNNAALESLSLELRTLNMEYQSALQTEDRMMSVKAADVSGFVRKGRSIISQEVNRTVNYYHEVSRIAIALRHYYAVPEVPLDNDNRTKPLLRNLCRSLTTAMGRLQEGMDVFERRLRDVAGCNAALKIGANDARPSSVPPTPLGSQSDVSKLDVPYTLPNVMRPSQSLEVSTTKQVRALTLFFSEYSEIIRKSFGDWAMLHGDLADLVNVIRNPDIREINWRVQTPALSPALAALEVPEDALSFTDDEDDLACIRSILFDTPDKTLHPDEGPSVLPRTKIAFIR